jgi:hypothetical protein
METLEINKGQRIYFKGDNIEAGETYGIGVFNSNKKFNVGGNIMSLIYGDDFENKTELIDDYQFKFLFNNNRNLISAKDLVLPATKLTEFCYDSMFYECRSLTEAPELPATKLTYACYAKMFDNAYNLIDAPKLPATELVAECYRYMFRLCTSLNKAPKLQATKLTCGCYTGMFAGCTSLNEITMLATDVSADDCLFLWVKSISKTGKFIKSKGVNIREGDSGIPEGWDVKEI